jgi:hypothetical protein
MLICSFPFFHARSGIQGTAADAYQLAVPGLNTAGQDVKAPKNKKSLTVTAGTYFYEI